MTNRTLMLAAPVFIAVILFAGTADANMMVSFMVGSWLMMVMALIPIIIVEALVLGVGFGVPALQSALIAASANIVSTFVGIPIANALYGGLARDRSAYLKPPPKTFGAKLAAIVRRVPWLDEGRWGANGFTKMEDGANSHGAALGLESWESDESRNDDEDWDEYEELELGPGIPFWMMSAATLVLLAICFIASWFVELSVALLWESSRIPSAALRDGVLYANLVSYGILAAVIGTITIVAFCSEEFDTSADDELDGITVEPLESNPESSSTDEAPHTGPETNLTKSAMPLSRAPDRPPDRNLDAA